jgi:hypothetical protein
VVLDDRPCEPPTILLVDLVLVADQLTGVLGAQRGKDAIVRQVDVFHDDVGAGRESIENSTMSGQWSASTNPWRRYSAGSSRVGT